MEQKTPFKELTFKSENTIYMGLLQNTDISCHHRNHSSHNLYLRPACAEKYCFERIMRKCRKTAPQRTAAPIFSMTFSQITAMICQRMKLP